MRRFRLSTPSPVFLLSKAGATNLLAVRQETLHAIAESMGSCLQGSRLAPAQMAESYLDRHGRLSAVGSQSSVRLPPAEIPNPFRYL